MKNIKQLLNEIEIGITIERLCHQLIENHDDFKDTIIVGVQPRGAFLNQRILDKLKCHARINDVQSGNIDISFYRDDLMRRENPIVPEVMDMNLSVEGRKVVLIDDVLFTGRSIRSALDALIAFGRPRSVELLTLIDRRFSRDLPIQADYVGKTINALQSEKIIVEWEENTGCDRVLISDSEL